MVCIQCLSAGNNTSVGAAGTRYNNILGGSTWGTDPQLMYIIASTSGRLTNLRVRLDTAIGASNSITLGVYKSTGITTLEVTISGAADTIGNDQDIVTVSAGDLICVQKVTTIGGVAGGAVAWWACDFIGDKICESIYGSGISDDTAAGASEGDTPYGGSNTWLAADYSSRARFIPTAGTIRNFFARIPTDPSVGDTIQFWIYKNGAAQTTTVTFAAGETGIKSDLVNSFTVAVGDYIAIGYTSTAGCAIQDYQNFGWTFVANLDGESIICARSTTDLDTLNVQWLAFYDGAPQTTEASRITLVTQCTLKKMWCGISGTPGAGNDYTFKLNVEGSPVNQVAVIENATTTEQDIVNTDVVSNGQTLNVEITPNSSPSLRSPRISIVCYNLSTIVSNKLRYPWMIAPRRKAYFMRRLKLK